MKRQVEHTHYDPEGNWLYEVFQTASADKAAVQRLRAKAKRAPVVVTIQRTGSTTKKDYDQRIKKELKEAARQGWEQIGWGEFGCKYGPRPVFAANMGRHSVKILSVGCLEGKRAAFRPAVIVTVWNRLVNSK